MYCDVTRNQKTIRRGQRSKCFDEIYYVKMNIAFDEHSVSINMKEQGGDKRSDLFCGLFLVYASKENVSYGHYRQSELMKAILRMINIWCEQ